MSVKAFEQCLAEHPAVAMACVLTASLSLPVTAFVTPHPGVAVSTAELQTWVSSRMGDLAPAADYLILEEMPRNRTGAVDRAALDAMRRNMSREQVA
ncbi:MAG TPA: hypothetical protein PLX03_06445 [Candidatus Hydrogenedentes bacterium]|nr:hypothetical protein [Candidatus Hydrogenedentota bacterium]